MPFFLNERDTASREWMDNPDCDRDELFNTYEQFSVINALISRWKYIYNSNIKPGCHNKNKMYSLLDIGFGGGDLPVKLSRWAESDGIKLRITAIETDLRAYEFVQNLETPSNITFRHISSTELSKEGHRFDFVISNHLLHHLGQDELNSLMAESQKISTQMVLFNDLERSDLGYLAFNLLSRPLFRNSFITHDGLLSIKRSYTATELKSTVPPGWDVERIFPYRLLLSYTHE